MFLGKIPYSHIASLSKSNSEYRRGYEGNLTKFSGGGGGGVLCSSIPSRWGKNQFR